MRLEIVVDESAVGVRTADIICDVLKRKQDAVLGLPTGETPKAAYAELSGRIDRGEVDVRYVRAFAIDEFLTGSQAAAGTNLAFFADHVPALGRSIGIVPFSLSNAEAESAVTAFAAQIRQLHGFDLCVLGIGANGHIAFNEPGSERDSRARVVGLTEQSRDAHAAAFGSVGAVPRRGVTLGVGDILESKSILVLAQGAAKAAIVARAIEGPQTADVPASWLQGHADVTWLLDEAAAAQLQRR
jgi:glucosamine-6-phosphate deaminase